MFDSTLETVQCTRRFLPILEPALVSVTFRRLLPNEFVVRYVMRHVSSMHRPLRCSVNVVIEQCQDAYHVALRGPACSRMGLSAIAPNLMAALRAALRQLEMSGPCPVPASLPGTGA